MWIDRKTYDDMRLDNAKAQTEARVLSEQNRAWQVTNDWLRVRLSQVEMQYAQMLYNYTGVKVNVPLIERAPEPATNPADMARLLQAMPSFDEVGDVEAGKLGGDWNSDGSIKTKTTE